MDALKNEREAVDGEDCQRGVQFHKTYQLANSVHFLPTWLVCSEMSTVSHYRIITIVMHVVIDTAVAF